MKHKPIDVTGKEIKVGDTVRIIGVPDLSGMSPGNIKETKPVFEYLVGKYKKVQRFDDFGCAMLQFSIEKGKNRGWHGVAIEPYLLRVKRQRPKII